MRYLVRELGNARLNTNTCFFLRVPALSCALSILGSIFRACLTTDLFPKSSPAQKCSGELTVPSRYFFLFFFFPSQHIISSFKVPSVEDPLVISSGIFIKLYFGCKDEASDVSSVSQVLQRVRLSFCPELLLHLSGSC